MSSSVSQTVDAYPTLLNCCAKSAPCQFCLLPSGQVVTNARFLETTRARLVLAVNGCDRDDGLEDGTLCYVTFPFDASLYSFVESIKTVRNGASSIEVHIPTPSNLTVANRRRSFRVPIVRPEDVQIEIRLADGTRIAGTAVKLAETSLEVELANGNDSLPVDAKVQIGLRLGPDSLEFPAVVCRCSGTRRALTFDLTDSPDSRVSVATIQRMISKNWNSCG